MRWILALVLVLGCGDDDGDPDVGPGDAGLDANDAGFDAGPPPTCLDTSEVLMLPTPLWGEGPLTPPDGDRAVALLDARPAWAGQLASLGGWPHRPTMVFALFGRATEVDASRIHLFDGDTNEEIAIPVEAAIEDAGEALVVIPRDPVADDVASLIVAIEEGAITGAVPVPACEGDTPHPGYASAAAGLTGEWALAMGFPLSTVHRELPALGATLSTTPVLVVESAELFDVADAVFPPSDAVLAAAETRIVDGVLTTPAYQGADGRFVIVDGVPVAQGTTQPGYTVLFPRSATTPFPWVVFQHGGGQHRHLALRSTDALLEAGFAIVAIDLPAHGNRAPAGGGTDFDILDFDDPLRSRDNLRQGAADHLAVITGVDALNAALAPISGEVVTLDPTQVRYTGLSLGAITGTMTFASSPELGAAALFVAGSGYQEILGEGLFNVLLSDVIRGSRLSKATVTGLAQVFLEGADPGPYSTVEVNQDRPLLFFEAIDDPLLPNPATDQWGRAFGADLALPSDHAVPGMEEVTLPASDAALRLLVQAPMAEVPIAERHGALIESDYGQDAVAHCFRTHVDTGACELIDTGWADR